MGSKKYPVENVFSKFIEDHAGSTNAYTSNENTNYHFEVATSNFKEALDMCVFKNSIHWMKTFCILFLIHCL